MKIEVMFAVYFKSSAIRCCRGFVASWCRIRWSTYGAPAASSAASAGEEAPVILAVEAGLVMSCELFLWGG